LLRELRNCNIPDKALQYFIVKFVCDFREFEVFYCEYLKISMFFCAIIVCVLSLLTEDGVLMEKGLTHIYFGDGKGKTTAALGLALRAAGCGKNVVIVQFLKNWKCGELNSLEQLDNITVFRGKPPGSAFVRDMSEEDILALKLSHDETLISALKLQENGQCDLLVLDEVIDAYKLGVLDTELFEGLMDNKPEPLELVVTGHGPDVRLFEKADYITEMKKHKHPFDDDIAARRGVEY